jgi:AAA15 family ATPase/GTPase
MLAQLTISNFAIVRELEIDFHSGMTAITGETGAGKSIAIDALGLCLAGAGRHGAHWRKPCRSVRPLLPERHPCRSALAGTEPA